VTEKEAREFCESVKIEGRCFSESHSLKYEFCRGYLAAIEKAKGLEKALTKIATIDKKDIPDWLVHGQWASQLAKEALAKWEKEK